MITPIDVLCMVIAVALIVLEGHRGVTLAVVDLVGVGATVVIAGKVYVRLMEYIPTASNAYLVAAVTPLLLVAGISVFLTRRTKQNVTGIEAAFGALAGLGMGILLAYVIYHYLVMKYGGSAVFLRNSLLAYQFAEDGVVHEMTSFMRTLMGR